MGAAKLASTITVAVTVVAQVPVVVFIVNVTAVADELAFVKVPLIAPLPLKPMDEVIPAGLVLVQLVIVPEGKPEILIAVIELPLHISWLNGEM